MSHPDHGAGTALRTFRYDFEVYEKNLIIHNLQQHQRLGSETAPLSATTVKLFKRKGSPFYSVRFRVPDDCLEAFDGVADVWKSTGTANKQEAEIIGMRWYLECVDKVERHRAAAAHSMTPQELLETLRRTAQQTLESASVSDDFIVESRIEEMLEEMAEESMPLMKTLLLQGDIEIMEAYLEKRRGNAYPLVRLATQGSENVKKALDMLPSTTPAPTATEAAQGRPATLIEAPVSSPSSPSTPAAKKPSKAPSRPSIDDMVALYTKTRKPSEGTLSNVKTEARRLAKYEGEHGQVTTVTEGRRYMRHIVDQMKAVTAKNCFNRIKLVFDISLQAGAIEHSPFTGVEVLAVDEKTEKVSKVIPPEAQRAVLEATKAGTDAPESVRWFVRVAAVTGMRITEFVTLMKEDVSVEDGVTIIRVRPEKNKTRERKFIPVHPEYGPAFAEWVAAQPDGRLFWMVSGQPYPDGGRCAEELSAILDDAGVSANVTTHWYRHTVETWMRTHAVPDAHARALTGRKERGSSASYGSAADARKVAESIGKLPLWW